MKGELRELMGWREQVADYRFYVPTPKVRKFLESLEVITLYLMDKHVDYNLTIGAFVQKGIYLRCAGLGYRPCVEIYMPECLRLAQQHDLILDWAYKPYYLKSKDDYTDAVIITVTANGPKPVGVNDVDYFLAFIFKDQDINVHISLPDDNPESWED